MYNNHKSKIKQSDGDFSEGGEERGLYTVQSRTDALFMHTLEAIPSNTSIHPVPIGVF